MHARRVEAEKEPGASKELVDVATELTMENYVEGSISVPAHYIRHDRGNHFDVVPRGVVQTLNPTEPRSRQRKPQQGTANDRDYYVSSVDRIVHIANAGTPVG